MSEQPRGRMRKSRTVIAATATLAAAATIVAVGVTANAQADPVAAGWCEGQSKIVVIGDSMSSGHGADNDANAWVRRIAASYPDAEVTNLATNGAMVSDFLPEEVGKGGRPSGPLKPDTVNKVESIKPSLVIIALGANEYGTDRMPRLTYGANLRELGDRIKAVSPNSSLLYVHTTGFDYRWASGKALPLEYEWEQYGAAMDEVAADNRYLDLTRFLPWAGSSVPGFFVVDEFGDGKTVHWADAGHVAAGAVIEQFLTGMCD